MNEYIEKKRVTVYNCKACGMVFRTKKEADDHEGRCIMIPENKSYATSRFLGVEKYPPFNKFANMNRPDEVAQLLGYHHKAYDTRTGQYIDDLDFYEEAPEYEEAERNSEGLYKKPEDRWTDEYEKFIDEVNKAAEANE